MRKLYFLILIFLSLSFISCTTPSYSFISADRENIMNFINTNGFKPLNHFDAKSSDYAIPNLDWINECFIPKYRKFIFDNNLSWYEENSNDCTQYTLYALACANMAYYENKSRLKNHSLSVGQFTYILNIYRHSLVFFIINDNNERKVIFFEPQLQKIVLLSEEEIRLSLDIIL